MSTSDASLSYLIRDGIDEEMAALIDSWRYRGEPIHWSAIVAHEAPIRRCQELMEKLARSGEELARPRIRVGAEPGRWAGQRSSRAAAP